MSDNLTACPCQSGKPYTECCQPFHLKTAFPETAEQLMRSRYAAYTLVKSIILWRQLSLASRNF